MVHNSSILVELGAKLLTPDQFLLYPWKSNVQKVGRIPVCHGSVQWGTLEGPGSRRIFTWQVIEPDQDRLTEGAEQLFFVRKK